MQTENKKGFQVKDLIVTALLSLCALVIYILCAFLSFSPYTMLVVSPLWSLLAAITYFLVAAKTKKPWTLFIFCAITGIYGFYPPMIICCIIQHFLIEGSGIIFITSQNMLHSSHGMIQRFLFRMQTRIR